MLFTKPATQRLRGHVDDVQGVRRRRRVDARARNRSREAARTSSPRARDWMRTTACDLLLRVQLLVLQETWSGSGLALALGLALGLGSGLGLGLGLGLGSNPYTNANSNANPNANNNHK